MHYNPRHRRAPHVSVESSVESMWNASCGGAVGHQAWNSTCISHLCRAWTGVVSSTRLFWCRRHTADRGSGDGACPIARVEPGLNLCEAMPKSTTCTRPVASTMMFPGLMSRWIDSIRRHAGPIGPSHICAVTLDTVVGRRPSAQASLCGAINHLGGIAHLSWPSNGSPPDMQLWPMWLDEAGELSFADAARARATIEHVAGRSTQWRSCQGDRWTLRDGSAYR
jgi:hypothetical protein